MKGEQNKNVVVEYGQLDLKQILSDYLKQKFIEELNKEEQTTESNLCTF